LKVVAASGWFAARPSGTEDIYKIYAESFKSEAHLNAIVSETQEMVNKALGSFRRRYSGRTAQYSVTGRYRSPLPHPETTGGGTQCLVHHLLRFAHDCIQMCLALETLRIDL